MTYPQRLLNVPIEEYHGGKGVSRSTLKVLEDGTPAACKHYMEHGLKETPAMALGSAVDCMVFEPELARELVVVRPAFGRSKADQAAKAEWEDAHAGKCILTPKQGEEAEAIARAVLSAKSVRKLLDNHEPQPSYYFVEDGTLVKTRPDAEALGHSFDLKTVADLSNRFLQTRIIEGAYAEQASMAQHAALACGREWKGHVIIWAGKDEPYDVRCQPMAPDSTWLIHAELRWKRWLRTYAACERSGHWPGYSERVTELAAPMWVSRKIEAEEEMQRAVARESVA